ncbi:MAG: sulfur carrier protein ThiS [Phycisphaeraceae bacterium]|nr:MAG: sulfur carrier protein ThiS [Phycisphaeraceae bacterium]
MKIIVNGESRDIPERLTVAELIEQLGLSRAACAVEINQSLAPRATHAERQLADGDAVEIVTLVGGG